MKKNDRKLYYVITLLFWAFVIDQSIENDACVWYSVLISNIATCISIFTLLFIASYAKR